MVQAVIKEDIEWAESNNLTLYLEQDRQQQFSFGQPLARHAIIHNQSGNCIRNLFGWTIHHALYDGWSLPHCSLHQHYCSPFLPIQQIHQVCHGS